MSEVSLSTLLAFATALVMTCLVCRLALRKTRTVANPSRVYTRQHKRRVRAVPDDTRGVLTLLVVVKCSCTLAPLLFIKSLPSERGQLEGFQGLSPDSQD